MYHLWVFLLPECTFQLYNDDNNSYLKNLVCACTYLVLDKEISPVNNSTLLHKEF